MKKYEENRVFRQEAVFEGRKLEISPSPRNMNKYEENMKKYKENMKKYEEIHMKKLLFPYMDFRI